MNKKRLLHSILTVLGVSLFVFTIWIISDADSGRRNIFMTFFASKPNGDKIGHVLLSGSLTLAANFLFQHRGYKIGKLYLPLGSLIVFILATIEESSQYFISSRTFDLKDALANTVGIILFSIPTYQVLRKKGGISA